MAIAAVGGASNQSITNVTTLTATYSPTLGNIVVLFLNLSAAVGSLVVKDSAGNILTAGPVSSNFSCWIQSPVPAGITGYTATWTTGVQCSIAVEEYSGAAGVSLPGTVATGSGTTATISATILQPNNWIVAGFGSAQTFTTTVGNSRQATTTSTARLKLQDNTSAVVGSVTNTATLTSAGWAALAVELGGPGRIRVDQDLTVALLHSTGLNARVDQDLTVALLSNAGVHARVIQDVLVVLSPTNLLRQLHVKRLITRKRKAKQRRVQKASVGFWAVPTGGVINQPHISIMT